MDEKTPRLRPLSLEEQQQMWENIKRAIDAKERRKRLVKIISVAAVTVILLSLGIITGYNTLTKPDVYFAETENSNIRLADGSVVTLLKGAKLTVEKSFPADSRDVFLEGDAFFKVTKSKEHPFIVHGSDYETKVLGTVFKVMQNGNNFNVDLYEGKVLVYRKGSKDATVLKPQQTFSNLGIPEVTSITKTAAKMSVETEAKPSILTFNECPIRAAVEVIEKMYGVRIYYPAGFENLKITVSLSNASADSFVKSLAVQYNLKIKRNNDSTFELEK
jgi:ferric-dicitrate binding protein FerR (iron transport regulator)